MKLVKRPTTQTEWEAAAANIIKAGIKLAGTNYRELSAELKAIGIDQSAAAISHKLHRGTFSATFFLQCLIALRVEQLALPSPGTGAHDHRDSPHQ